MRFLIPLLPALLSFGPLFIAIGSTPETVVPALSGYGGSLALGVGLMVLLTITVRQERRIHALEARLEGTVAGPADGGTGA